MVEEVHYHSADRKLCRVGSFRDTAFNELRLRLQVQFLIIFVHTLQIQFQPNCNFPKSIAALLTFNAGLFTYMFSSFYVHNYKKEAKQAAQAKKAAQAKLAEKQE